MVKDVGVGYALETQNRPVFDTDEGETVKELTNVHEWAHQWYGNSVTLSDWSDIWLNEGFAAYAEWLWTASHGGPSTAEQFQQAYDDAETDWSVTPIVTDPEQLFDDMVYLRGGMTLEALRQEVGSRDFFVISASGRSGMNTAMSRPLTSLRCPSGYRGRASTPSSKPGSIRRGDLRSASPQAAR